MLELAEVAVFVETRRGKTHVFLCGEGKPGACSSAIVTRSVTGTVRITLRVILPVAGRRAPRNEWRKTVPDNERLVPDVERSTSESERRVSDGEPAVPP